MDGITILGLCAAFFTTVSFLPQAIKTIRTRDTSAISLFMYVLFTIGTLLWLAYGFITHNLPIQLANIITTGLAAIILYYKIREKASPTSRK